MHLLVYAFIAITCIQLLYYCIVFSRFFSIEKNHSTNKVVPISILICARNEAQNLKENLPFILSQNYPEFEVVLINDRSYDNTLEVMESFREKHPNKIKIVDVTETKNGGSKKYALTLGIKAASHEQLLFTDADCKPASNTWISEMVAHFNEEISIALGYGAYASVKNSLLNKLIRYETVMTALQYFSYAKIGMPYMGVGRNLAYTKTLFFEQGGFANHLHLKSGDDDLFVNQAATNTNLALSINKNSFTISQPKTSFKAWIRQKRRHVSTSNYYQPIHKILLGLFYLSQLLFWILAIALFNLQIEPILITAIFTLRIGVQYLILYKTTSQLQEKGITILTPILELLLILTHLFIFSKNLIKKPTHW